MKPKAELLLIQLAFQIMPCYTWKRWNPRKRGDIQQIYTVSSRPSSPQPQIKSEADAVLVEFSSMQAWRNFSSLLAQNKTKGEK